MLRLGFPLWDTLRRSLAVDVFASGLLFVWSPTF